MGINVGNWIIWQEGMMIEGWITDYEDYERKTGLDASKEIAGQKEELRLHKVRHKAYYDKYPLSGCSVGAKAD